MLEDPFGYDTVIENVPFMALPLTAEDICEASFPCEMALNGRYFGSR